MASDLWYSHTTIWAGRFDFGTLMVTDTRATTGKSRVDNFVKFHIISKHLMLLGSGSVRVIDMCLQILRNTATILEINGENVPQELLVEELKNNQDFIEVVRQLHTLTSTSEPEGAELLLISNIGEAEKAVCQIKIKDTVTSEFSRSLGCGSGYWAARDYLDKLQQDATKDYVISQAISSLLEASKREKKTGGRAIIISSDGGGPWNLDEDYELIDYNDWGL